MIPECQHIYETGRKCRRIPKRGDDLCPGHRPQPNRSFHDEPGFVRQLHAFACQISQLPLLDQLATLQDALAAARPILDRDAARRHARAAYIPIARAIVAVTVAISSLDQAQTQAQTQASSMQSRPNPHRTPAHSYAQHPAAHRIR
jgi:hypothetical protein